MSDVDPKGPSGNRLRIGDVLTAVNGEPVYSTASASVRIARLAPGAEAKLSIVRRGAAQDVTVVVRAAVLASSEAARVDLRLVLRAAPGVGSEVISVSPRSAGAQAGLLPGDFTT